MLPLALWALSPYQGCECADGTVKLICLQLLGGDCSHCRSGDGSEAACCQAGNQTQLPGEGSTQHSCHMIAGDVTVQPEASPLLIGVELPALLLAADTVVAAPIALAAPADAESPAPPLDRVIAHCRLVI